MPEVAERKWRVVYGENSVEMTKHSTTRRFKFSLAVFMIVPREVHEI